jgi:hypothetical protein
MPASFEANLIEGSRRCGFGGVKRNSRGALKRPKKYLHGVQKGTVSMGGHL